LSADGSDASFLLQAGAEHKVLVVPGYLASAQHLQILAAQQQQEQQHPPAQQQQQQHVELSARLSELPVCPFFRVSFASVGPEAMLEGFARLRAAIVSREAS